MDNNQEILSEVMKYVYRQYARVTEIERLTRELETVLNSDDREAAQIILDMRQREMEEASQGKRAVGEILEAMDEELKADTKLLLKGELPPERREPEAEKISNISGQMKNTLDRICRIDKVLSKRVAGESSYYKD